MSTPITPGDIDFAQAVGRLHTEAFGEVANSPWYGDAVYARFSDEDTGAAGMQPRTR